MGKETRERVRILCEQPRRASRNAGKASSTRVPRVIVGEDASLSRWVVVN
jgi:hypothetical protein